ncbi:hypothetical protein [Streptomyces microflavus]|uniref:hypothetical protein n=1 Tax=Streptomyces microflavus TaxID=1919 RepID=UPI0033B57780
MSHIIHEGRTVKQGEEFEPRLGYKLRFVRDEGLRIVLRDAIGEFTRPVSLNVEPRENRPMKLNERRTLIELVPDARPIVGEEIYAITHQVCVPGGWQDIKSCRVRSALGHAGVHSNNAGIEDDKLRSAADTLWKTCNAITDALPLTELWALKLKVGLQEGTGEVGGWDDPAVAMRMTELLDAANIT